MMWTIGRAFRSKCCPPLVLLFHRLWGRILSDNESTDPNCFRFVGGGEWEEDFETSREKERSDQKTLKKKLKNANDGWLENCESGASDGFGALPALATDWVC